MIFLPKRLSTQIRWVIAVVSLLLALPGLPIGLGSLCFTLLLILDNEAEAILVGITGLTLMAVITGTGGAIFWHSFASIKEKIPGQLNLPSAKKLFVIFWLYIVLGLIIFQSRILAGLLFPPTILVAAALPPLFAVAWFGKGYFDRLSHRQSLVVFSGAAMGGLFLGGILWVLLAIMTSILFSGVTFDERITALMGIVNETWLNPPWRIYLLIQITLIYPVVVEFVKPLIALPLLSHRSRRETFLLGAIAGAGFATLETVILTGIGFQIWALLLIWQFLSCAIHPLGAGLTALGWRDFLRRRGGVEINLVAGFGAAVAMQALRNLGFLALVSLARDGLFAGIALWLGLINLILGAGLGLAALWVGRSIAAQHLELADRLDSMPKEATSKRSNQAVAIWAVVCLAAILPVGVVGVQFLL
jgi:hypothetical protein